MQPASHHNGPDQPAVTRRKLAENVICLFPDDRPPVSNPRWRGRYPRNIVSKGRFFWRARPLAVGDVVEIVCGQNAGKRVRVRERSFKKGADGFERGHWCYVDAGAYVLQTYDVDTGQPDPQLQRFCYFKKDDLRRVK